MNIVFFGTSDFAARILEYLFRSNFSIKAVITRPDKPKGRSLQLLPPPVKEKALELQLPIYQPAKASTEEFAQVLKTFNPDLFVVVAYGEIIKKNLLTLPKLGCINVHASILPKYRGAAPIQRALMAGEKEAGVTIMSMVLEMDAGDVLAVAKIPVDENMTFGELSHALSEIASPALAQVIRGLAENRVKPTAQNQAEVTFAPKITAEEEQIDWNKPAEQIHNLIRALAPTPGAWCFVQLGEKKMRLKIKRSEIVRGIQGKPRDVVLDHNKELIVICEQNGVRLLEVQLEGKKTMFIKDFLRGLNQSIKF